MSKEDDRLAGISGAIRQAEASKQADAARELFDIIRPFLGGVEPGVQGATLTLLVTTFIAGHHPEIRDEQIALFMRTVQGLVPVEVEEMIALGMVGPDWRGPEPFDA